MRGFWNLRRSSRMAARIAEEDAKIAAEKKRAAEEGVFVAIRWQGEIRVTQQKHRRLSDACVETFGNVLPWMEWAAVGGPGRIAADNKLAWKRVA